MRSDGNPARLWPATQRHFLCPWGSGLPARAISFMENSGLFSGFIKIDEKTNKIHGLEHFTCNPLRDPQFRNICTKLHQWDQGPNQSFHQREKKICRHVFIQGSFQRSATISCNCNKFWCIRTREQKSWWGGTVSATAQTKPRKKLFFLVQGTLQGLETSAARSQIV